MRFFLTAVAIFFCVNVLGNSSNQSPSPCERKLRFGTSAANSKIDISPTSLTECEITSTFGGSAKPQAVGSYVIEIYFNPTPDALDDDTIAENVFIPPPIAGKVPVLFIRRKDWVGKIQWRKLGSDGLVQEGVPSIFKSGASYVAQISWTTTSQPENQNSGKIDINVVTSNKFEVVAPVSTKGSHGLSDSVYSLLEGNPPQFIPPQVGASKALTLVASPSFEDVAKNLAADYGSGAVNPEIHEQSNAQRQITLPDLGGEVDRGKPQMVKKTYNPEQALANSQMGSPDTPMVTSPLGVPLGTSAAGVGKNNAPNPKAIGVNVGDAGAGATITPVATDLRFESKDYLGHVGINYINPKSSYGAGIKVDGAYLLGKTAAIGANLLLNNNMKEVVLSGVWIPEGTNLKTRLSTSYMWGQQKFDFYSGNAEANLSQASYYFSTQYIVPKEQSSYLHTLGVSTWGSKAKQTNNPVPVNVLTETASAYQRIMDPRKLAVGTLQGEALEAQVGITKQIVAKVSAGYETLKFPFSDGSQELDKRIYQDYVVQFQPVPEVALQAGYKIGAAMNNIMLSVAYSQWKATGFKNIGVNGVAGSQGAMLTYSLPLDGVASKAFNFGTLTRPELIGNNSYILRDAATRPIQLPQAFLAKVDTTAVKTLATIDKAGLPPGATVNAIGDVVVPVGIGSLQITQVMRNNVPYDDTSAIRVAENNIVITPKSLPRTTGGDSYVISVRDSTNASYLVRMSTQN